MAEEQFHVGRFYNFTANLAFERQGRHHSLRLGLVTMQGDFLEFNVFPSLSMVEDAAETRIESAPMGVKIRDNIYVLEELGPVLQDYLSGRFPGGTIFEVAAREAILADELLNNIFPATDRFVNLMTGCREMPAQPWGKQALRDRFDELVRSVPARVEARVKHELLLADGVS